MKKPGFDSQKYIRLQSEHIRERIRQFGGKLYLEFGGKLFDDYHASRVLPGFAPDNKIQMLLQLKDQAEIVIAINANDIEKNKRRGDLGITYDTDLIRLVDVFRSFGLYVGSIALNQYSGQPSAALFETRMKALAEAGGDKLPVHVLIVLEGVVLQTALKLRPHCVQIVDRLASGFRFDPILLISKNFFLNGPESI